MLEQMLPGPLANLKFVKVEFGPVPLKLSHVDVHKTTQEGIKLDMNLDWDGKCDFELDGSMVDRKSTRLNSSHSGESRMPSSA